MRGKGGIYFVVIRVEVHDFVGRNTLRYQRLQGNYASNFQQVPNINPGVIHYHPRLEKHYLNGKPMLGIDKKTKVRYI